MRPSTPEERYEQARRIHEMTALVDRHLAGAATREELLLWALSVRSTGQAGPFPGHANANGLHECLRNLDETLSQTQEPLIRRCDLVEYLRLVRVGDRDVPDEERIATLKMSTQEIALRTRLETVRFLEDQMGWFEGVRFASSALGQTFIAVSPLENLQGSWGALVRGVRRLQSPAERSLALAELFDSLGIDADDAVELCSPATLHWDLMRLDDNGNTFLVASFTGYAKARARLAQFATTRHKQTYWLEDRQTAAVS